MKTFIVVRYGSNAANQSRCNRLVLGTAKAETEAEAQKLVNAQYTCYNNQYFELLDMAGRTRKADREAAATADAPTPNWA